MVGFPLQYYLLREKEKEGENFYKAFIGTLSYDCSLPINRYLIGGFVIKILIIIFIFTNTRRPFVCGPLGLYVLLVNNFTNLITSYWSNFINYLDHHID